MGTAIPPPPTRAESGDFAWIDWYNKLNNLLNTSGTIAWAVVDKSGSSIADIQTRDHNLLTSIQGGTTNEYYHLTAAQYASVGAGNHNDLNAIQGGNTTERYHLTNAQLTNLNLLIGQSYVNSFNTRVGAVTLTNTDVVGALTYTPANSAFISQAADPTTVQLPSGQWRVYKNTTSGTVKLWANDGGTLKSVTLT